MDALKFSGTFRRIPYSVISPGALLEYSAKEAERPVRDPGDVVFVSGVVHRDENYTDIVVEGFNPKEVSRADFELLRQIWQQDPSYTGYNKEIRFDEVHSVDQSGKRISQGEEKEKMLKPVLLRHHRSPSALRHGMNRLLSDNERQNPLAEPVDFKTRLQAFLNQHWKPEMCDWLIKAVRRDFPTQAGKIVQAIREIYTQSPTA